MNKVNQYIEERLAERMQKGAYRTLRPDSNLIDFSSNDYLGFARSTILKQMIDAEIQLHQNALNGSTGSRLLAGNSNYAIELEEFVATTFNSEAGLLYNSGYDANIGLLSCLPQRGDTVLHDELIHASIIDGIRLSNANRYTFRHNDLQHLEEKLKRISGRCYVVVESIYSMDGDAAPLPALSDLCNRFGASFIVDEAHATGLFGKGKVHQLGLEYEVFARVITFGKALGCHGAIVLGRQSLINYLINFSRSFIYTTAAPFHQLAAIKMSCQHLDRVSEDVLKLQQHINVFTKLMNNRDIDIISSESAIQCIISGGNSKAKAAANTLLQEGFDVRPILAPTVAVGTERLRICLHSYNTNQQVKDLTTILEKIIHE